jgi:hypothetical protein
MHAILEKVISTIYHFFEQVNQITHLLTEKIQYM